MVNPKWKDHAHPLQLITIQLQGTRHSDQDDMLSYLKEIVARIENGDRQGEMSDDDFGYRFELSSPDDSIFGDEGCSYK